ncbi:MAG: HNH endonuclease [Fuerstiella sp.]
MTLEVQITRGLITTVDDVDEEIAKQFKWHAVIRRLRTYVGANVPGTGGHGKRQKYVYLHRQIMSADPHEQVDHINGDGLNNTRSNLRICTPAQNAGNRRVSLGNSRFKGVHFCSSINRWRAQIQQETIGLFDDEVAAAAAYDSEAVLRYGEFAALNLSGDVVHIQGLKDGVLNP